MKKIRIFRFHSKVSAMVTTNSHIVQLRTDINTVPCVIETHWVSFLSLTHRHTELLIIITIYMSFICLRKYSTCWRGYLYGFGYITLMISVH